MGTTACPQQSPPPASTTGMDSASRCGSVTAPGDPLRTFSLLRGEWVGSGLSSMSQNAGTYPSGALRSWLHFSWLVPVNGGADTSDLALVLTCMLPLRNQNIPSASNLTKSLPFGPQPFQQDPHETTGGGKSETRAASTTPQGCMPSGRLALHSDLLV